MIHVLEIMPNVLVCVTKNQYTLASAFMRIQEFYESQNPDFRGSYFSHDQYMDWYANTHGGRFSYFEDWNGFNVPGHVMDDFIDKFGLPNFGGAHDMWPRESTIFYSVLSYIDRTKPYYIIGVHLQRLDCLEHEIAHALFQTSPSYKEAIVAKMGELFSEEYQKTMDADLRKMGYSDHVLEDERQAYLTTTHDPAYYRKHFTVEFDPDKTEEMNEVFRQFANIEEMEHRLLGLTFDP